jgi:hypothetical protein
VWLRAYRNLARFRPQALQLDVLSRKDQGVIFDWHLEVFARSQPTARNQGFLQSVYLAPQILKRRRYDSQFLAQGTDDYQRFDKILARAERETVSKRLRVNAEVAREFLSKTATGVTIEKLSQNEK